MTRLLDGVGPVLDPHPLLEQRVVPTGDVSSGDDARHVACEGFVTPYAVFDVYFRTVEPGHRGPDPNANHDQVTIHSAAVVEPHVLDAGAAAKPFYAPSAEHPYTPALVCSLQNASKPRTQALRKRGLQGFNHGNFEP